MPRIKQRHLRLAVLLVTGWPTTALWALAAGAGDPAEACLAEPWPAARIRCLSQTAASVGAVDPCLRADDPAAVWMCVAHYAEAVRDPATCRAIPAKMLEPEGVLQDLCLAHLAIAWKDPALCEPLTTPNMRDSCLLQLVEAGADPGLCEEIEHAEIRGACGGSPGGG